MINLLKRERKRAIVLEGGSMCLKKALLSHVGTKEYKEKKWIETFYAFNFQLFIT